MKFTVLLLCPDYMANTFGHDTYLAHVTVSHKKEAVPAAQRMATKEVGEANDPEDFHPLMMVQGHQTDLLP